MKSDAQDMWFEPHEAVGGMTYRALTEPARDITGHISMGGRTVSTPWSPEHYPVDVQLAIRRHYGWRWPEVRQQSPFEMMLWMTIAFMVGIGLVALASWFDGRPIWRG